MEKNDLISRKELISRLNNSANRYHGGKCNGIEYKDVETFDVDEVYEIIDRVWEGVPEDNGKTVCRREECVRDPFQWENYDGYWVGEDL